MDVRSSGQGSVAVGHNAGIVSTGANASIHFVDNGPVPNPSQVPCPIGLTNLGALDSHVFVGRHAELRQIADAASGASGRAVVVLAGENGVGKATLAREFARRNLNQYILTWVLRADSYGSVEADLIDLAERLEPKLNPSPADLKAAWGLSWLQSHSGWLLVVEDVRSSGAIGALLDLSSRGLLLVTSSSTVGWEHSSAVIRIAKLSTADAVDLLMTTAGASAELDRDDAASLCDDLGLMPGPVVLAAMQIARTDVSAVTYHRYMRSLPRFVRADTEQAQRYIEPLLAIAGAQSSRMNSRDRVIRLLSTDLAGRLIDSRLLSERWSVAALKAIGLTDAQFEILRESRDRLDAAEKAKTTTRTLPPLSTGPVVSRHPRRRHPLEMFNNAVKLIVVFTGFMLVAAAAGSAAAERHTAYHVGLGNWVALVVSSVVILVILVNLWEEALEAIGATTTVVSLSIAFAAGWILTAHRYALHIASSHVTLATIGTHAWAFLIWRF